MKEGSNDLATDGANKSDGYRDKEFPDEYSTATVTDPVTPVNSSSLGGGSFPESKKVRKAAGKATNPASQLNRIEQDMMSKSATDTDKGASNAKTPGVFSVAAPPVSKRAPASSVVGQENTAKASAGRKSSNEKGRSGSAKGGTPLYPGVEAVEAEVGNTLNQLERDIMGKMSGSRTRAAAAAPSTKSSITEQQDALIKQRVASGAPPVRQSESDAAIKARVSGKNSFNQPGNSTRASTSAAGQPSYPRDEVRDKIAASLPSTANAPYGHGGYISQSPVTSANTSWPVASSFDNHSHQQSQRHDDYPLYNNASYTAYDEPAAVSSVNYKDIEKPGDHFDNEITASDFSSTQEPVISDLETTASNYIVPSNNVSAQTSVYASPESPMLDANVYRSQDVVENGAGGGGIEAFVAATVIDAEGVEVVKSDEEEGKLIWKRQKRQYICCGIIIIIIVAAIAASVGVTSNNKSKAQAAVVTQPTIAPSVAPSSVPSSSPTTQNFVSTIQELQSVSSQSSLRDKSSPQYRAAEWISSDNYVKKNSLDPSNLKYIQRYVLAVFYFGLGGDSWEKCGRQNTQCKVPNATQWLSEEDECTWLNLRCKDGFINEINFVDSTDYREQGSNILSGTLVPETVHLTKLEDFVAIDMQLKGSIVGHFSNASDLRSLQIVRNFMTGTIPEQIGLEHPFMTTLKLNSNKMTGELPTSLFSVETLQDLELSANNFVGTLTSTTFSQLGNLRTLDLSTNQIAGQPSTFFEFLSNITSLQLGNTGMIGTLGTEIGYLENLQQLFLGGTNMTGSLPSDIYALSQLSVLELSGAHFTGTLSSDIQNLTGLQTLDLSANDFNGPVPSDALHVCANLETIALDGNSFTGTITQALCDDRGSQAGQIQSLRVGEGVLCNCCD